MIKKLKKGDLIDIISPASCATFEDIKKIKEYLAQKGFRSRYFLEDKIAIENEETNKFPSSSGKARYEQLKMAIDAPDSVAIWCTNGGYGSSDLIEFLQKDERVAQTKQFIGYSDITVLATFFGQNWGWETIYGPMLRQLSQKKLQKQSENAIFELICQENLSENAKENEEENEGENLSFYQKFNISCLNGKNQAIGELVGGCVSVLAHDLGTKNQIDWGDKILLLEDVEEKGEKLDRVFTEFLQIMTENNSYPKAILFGNFVQFIEDESLIKNIKIAIAKFIKNIASKAPEVSIFQENNGYIGHGDAILPVTLGKEITVDGKILLQKN